MTPRRFEWQHPRSDDVDLVIMTMAKTIVDNADYFAQLDAVAGDGDFGYSLRNGFEVVLSDFDTFDRTSVGPLLKKVGLRDRQQGRRRERADLGHRFPAGRRRGGRPDAS